MFLLLITFERYKAQYELIVCTVFRYCKKVQPALIAVMEENDVFLAQNISPRACVHRSAKVTEDMTESGHSFKKRMAIIIILRESTRN